MQTVQLYVQGTAILLCFPLRDSWHELKTPIPFLMLLPGGKYSFDSMQMFCPYPYPKLKGKGRKPFPFLKRTLPIAYRRSGR